MLHGTTLKIIDADFKASISAFNSGDIRKCATSFIQLINLS